MKKNNFQLKKNYNIVLVGNPNCGKTAMFNSLTKSSMKVGNWPGVTVTKQSGFFYIDDIKITLIDLPGIYSLEIFQKNSSLEETVTCEYLVSQKIDLIVNVVDALNLERNLYLTTQLINIGIPYIIVVNMMDIARKRNISLNLSELSNKLCCEVVESSATKKGGMDALKKILKNSLKTKKKDLKAEKQHITLPLPTKIKKSVLKISKSINQTLLPHASISHNWISIKLLEGNIILLEDAHQKLMKVLEKELKQLKPELEEDIDIIIADARYSFIHSFVHKIYTKGAPNITKFNETLDKIILNRILGLPIFLFVIYFIFYFSIRLTDSLQKMFNIFGETLFVNLPRYMLYKSGAPEYIINIISDGAGRGISTIISFIPVVGGMFFILAFLENAGYMSRAAFLMDKMMRIIKLPGKSFLPMLMGFGCNVPAILATRTLGYKQDRILTIMMLPFMSCGARMAIFAVFASAFFPTGGHNIVFLLYIIGISCSILTGIILKKTLLKGNVEPLIMELPSYNFPGLKLLTKLTLQKIKDFILRVGKFMIPFCFLIGALNILHVKYSPDLTFNISDNNNMGNSILSNISKKITPLFSPLGIKTDNWEATVGLIAGIAAKESIIGTLNTLYSQEESDLLYRKEKYKDSAFEQFNFTIASLYKKLKTLKSHFKKNKTAPPEDEKNISGIITKNTNSITPSYGIMYKKFHGKLGAFTYLIFVLLYFPCIATIMAIKEELNWKWATFSIMWSTGIAYSFSTLFYQFFTIKDHILSSIGYILIVTSTMTIVYIVLNKLSKNIKRKSKNVD